ncbi:nuclear transport factor 2 family protein [Kribbella sp. NPDC049174]|uniref:nuclear transport factor 2 family protein n=1 Tax=Kribbella sp. NPDC049174 TaxID=3364112 RepID=UPI00370F97F6
MAAESSADDRAAVVRTALDYFEGWFDGDAARIESALHPELAKRSLGQDSSDPEQLATLTAPQMIEATARGEGRREDPGDRRIEVEVEHLYGTIANATVRSAVYVEYLQLVHTRHGWKIVNALWAYTTPSQDQ